MTIEALVAPAKLTLSLRMVGIRDDGYHQDRASQLVVEAVLTAGWEGSPGHGGERILDLCAAPGGKATALAASGARVVACDLRERRLGGGNLILGYAKIPALPLI